METSYLEFGVKSPQPWSKITTFSCPSIREKNQSASPSRKIGYLDYQVACFIQKIIKKSLWSHHPQILVTMAKHITFTASSAKTIFIHSKVEQTFRKWRKLHYNNNNKNQNQNPHANTDLIIKSHPLGFMGSKD